MSRTNVHTDYKFGDSDAFMLTDIDTHASISMIPCDTAGNFSWTGVTRAPLTRNAMQTSTTSNQYSDLERPWISIPQEDWTRGRGNDIFSKDTTRYRDGKRAQASFNQVIFNGPLDYYSQGFRKAETNCPGSLVWKKLQAGKEKYIAVKISPTVSFTAGELYIHLRRRGTPTSPLVVELVSSLTSTTALRSHSYTTSEITDTLAEFSKFTFNNTTLTAGNNYYIRVHSDNATKEDYWEVGIKQQPTQSTYCSSDNRKYQIANFDLFYRIAEPQTNYSTKFFQYEQIMFMIRQKIGSAPTLWMNGDICKATSATSTTITDSTKAWETNQYKGARIGLVYKNGSQEHATVWRTIVANSTDTISVETSWNITPSAGCIYIIVDTPIWNQISDHGLTSYITDVHVINGVVYFAQGDYVDARKMRWNNGSFEWMTLTDIKASFLQSVRDSSGMMLYRGRNDGINGRRTVERSRLLDWRTTEKTWTTLNGSNAVTTAEPLYEKDVLSTSVTKNGDGDNTTTTTTETSTHQVGDSAQGPLTTTSSTSTTTESSTSKDQYNEYDIFEGTTKKVVAGGTTTTTIDEMTTHKVGNKTVSEVGVKSKIVETDKEGTGVDENGSTGTGIVGTGVTVDPEGNVYDGQGNLIGRIDDGELVPSEGGEGDDGEGTIANADINKKKESTTKTTKHLEPATGTGVVSEASDTITRETTRTNLVIHTTQVTSSQDFTYADRDATQYIFDITSFVSDNATGKLVITLQGSEDNAAFHDVATVTATSAGRWYLFAHCPYRYRRFVITALGTNCTVTGMSITTSQVPHFEDPVILVDNYGKITRLFEYGAEMTKSLWIAQEGMLSSINKVEGTTDTYTHDRINIDELETTAEAWNGKAMNTADVYLLWGWLNGLQRYYNTQLEGKGPDHDEGLPFERQGRVSQIVSYPSNFFISIDGEDGYSSVMQFNQSGWHEIYRAPNAGERIYDMAFQPIYGNRPDRLWLNVGDDIIWLTMPSKILYAIQDQYAEYTHESVLISAWHTAGMMDIEKLWQTLKIMADYLDGKNCWVEADYQTDEEKEWHPIRNWYVESPSQKEDLSPSTSVNGKKLRYRLRLQSTDMHKTPKVNVVVLEAVGRVDIKMSYNFYFRNIKYKRDLTAEFEDIEPLDVQEVLDDWANKLKKLRLNSRWKIFDNKLVYLDSVQTSVLNELSEGYIGQITLNEL